MKKAYFVDINRLYDPDAPIIDEATLDAAERGENYLNPDDFILHGKYADIEEARQALWNEQGEALYWKQHPELTTIII
jgi:hypothetical protein